MPPPGYGGHGPIPGFVPPPWAGGPNPGWGMPPTAAPQEMCDWSEHTAPDGKKYYYNSKSGQSIWEKPKELIDFEQRQNGPPPSAISSAPMTKEDQPPKKIVPEPVVKNVPIPKGKKHALNKYEQFIQKTSIFCTMCDFSQFWSHLCRTMHCLPQRLKSTFFEIFSNGAALKGPAE